MPVVFTSDGRLMALGIAPDQVMLADAASGRELARLTTMQPVNRCRWTSARTGQSSSSPQGKRQRWSGTCGGFATNSRRSGWTGTRRRIRKPADGERGGLVVVGPQVRVIGAVIEPRARRAAELAELDRRLAAEPADPEALFTAHGSCPGNRSGARPFPILSEA